MSRKKQLSLSARATELKELIADCEQIADFSPLVLQGYKSQLSQVQAELTEINEKKRVVRHADERKQPKPTNTIPSFQQGNEVRDNTFTSYLSQFSNIPENEKIFIPCANCKREFSRKTMEDKLCSVCLAESQLLPEEVTQEVLIK